MLESVRSKIERLIAAYEKEKVECEELHRRLEKSERDNDAYRKQIIELKKQIDNRKLADAFMAGGLPEESKKKIDRLLREIDRCTALMEG